MKRSFVKLLVCGLALLTMASFTACGDKETTSSNPGAPQESEISRIVGTWREDSEFGINVLTIDQDGSYVLYHTSGGTENGNVVVDGDVHSDGTSDSWFSLYGESGDLWIGFPNLPEYAKNPPTELFSESEEVMHFVRIDENEKTPAEDYVGIWGCGRCTITITKTEDGYNVNIIWGSSASEYTEWNYNCQYDKETATLICDGNATQVNHVYNEKGKDKKTTVYKDGSGSFKARGGVLRWTDDKEDAGKSMYFAYSPSQE